MVKSLMKNSKEKTLTIFIKVKNYSKFMPGSFNRKLIAIIDQLC